MLKCQKCGHKMKKNFLNDGFICKKCDNVISFKDYKWYKVLKFIMVFSVCMLTYAVIQFNRSIGLSGASMWLAFLGWMIICVVGGIVILDIISILIYKVTNKEE